MKLSKNDALQRYGRSEADPDDASDAALVAPAQPSLPGFANEGQPASGRAGCPQPAAASTSLDNLLTAFKKDSKPLAKAIEDLLKDLETADPAAARDRVNDFLANLNDLIPDDPATAAVIAEEMAKQFSSGPRPLADEEVDPETFYFFNEDREENGRFDTKGSGDKTHGSNNESNMERRKRTSREALDAYNASTDHPSIEDVASGKVSVEDALKKGFEIKFGGQKIIFFTDALKDHYEGREGRLALVKKAIADRNKLMPGRHYDGQTVLMSQKHLNPTEKKLVVIADADTGVARSIMMAQQNYCDKHFKLWGRK